MRTFLKYQLLIFISFALIACSDKPSINASSASTNQSSAQKIKEITVNDLTKNYLDEHLIIDVRELNELNAGMIPNAIHMPMGDIAENLPYYLKQNFQSENFSELKDKPILLYCAGGVRSYRSAETLKQLGFTNLTSLEGGFNAYKDENN